MDLIKVNELDKALADISVRISSLECMENTASRSLQSSFDTGDTAWMLASTALVLFMTIPGLALYYSGMTRTKNVLTTIMQCFSITCIVTLCWLCFGYSLSFGPASANQTSSPVFGDESRFWLRGMKLTSWHQLAPTVPEGIFCAYQLTFAIFTPVLICGSFADRMKFPSMLLFISLWHFIVYCPVAHSVWHPEGFLYKAGALDFAGGLVVHISSGISGLVSAIVVGHRKGFNEGDFVPHNILLTAVGTSMLWIGWFGFTAGSAYHANGRASMALMMTQIATASAGITWVAVEWIVRKQPSVLGMMSGAVAGLVAITPAAGYVDTTGAFFIGFFAGPFCYAGVHLKRILGYDDALDSFGVHALGGILGAILTGFFATDYIDGSENGVFYAGTKVGGTQLGNQIYGIVVVGCWAALMTFLILKFVDLVIGLRVSEQEEEAGLDVSVHGERPVDEKVAKSSSRDATPASEPVLHVEGDKTA